MLHRSFLSHSSSLKPPSTFFSKPSSSIPIPFPKLPSSLRLPPSLKNFSSASQTSPMASQIIEHVVLFNIKQDTHPTKIDAMVSNLSGLTSLNQVLHLTAGPISRTRSSPFKFTHLLHSRYKTKEDLNEYSAHPNHLTVVKESVLPICDDVMAVDWVSGLDEPSIPRPGSALRLTLLKPKETAGDGGLGQILEAIGGIKGIFPSIDQISFGENFSPARAKGFSVGSLSFFPGLKEIDLVDSNEEVVKSQKDKVRDLIESVIVVDYVIPPPPAANL
eukprot:TRINITY_DN23922_c0_g1_i1.p1 TRINITY_DN23922_c0_g1~~TRINITY_DN23922_c0_g1_i1.p1  ORF type:complete len:275 (+),score=33.91 TRINITY_DN23922_c0_g1_i1:51-875(+)